MRYRSPWFVFASVGVTAVLETGGGNAACADPAGDDLEEGFGGPQRVTIKGYDEAGGAMEPFVTRDDRYLLFNSQPRDGEPPDLHYAESVDERTFRYRGRVEGANSDSVDGAPSLDRTGRLYFISPRDYETRLATIYAAQVDSAMTP